MKENYIPLKPCPFCEKPPDLTKVERLSTTKEDAMIFGKYCGSVKYIIKCNYFKCHIKPTITIYGKLDESAIAKWNSRNTKTQGD